MKFRIFVVSFLFAFTTILLSQTDEEAFRKLKTFFFQKCSSKVEQDILRWQKNFVSSYGHEAFDSLLERYLKTKEFKMYSQRAQSLQQTKAALVLKKKIERIREEAIYYFRKLKSWDFLKRTARIGSINPRRQVLINSIDWKRQFYQEKYNFFIRQYDELVARYNCLYYGNLPFWKRIEENLK